MRRLKQVSGRIISAGLLLLLSALSMVCIPRVSYGDSLLEDVKTGLKNPDWQMQLSAVEKLGSRKDRDTVDILLGIAENRRENWRVQIKAIQLLGEAGDPRSIDLLTHILNSSTSDWKCPAIQSYAATALGNFRNYRLVSESLVKGMQSGELIIREASIRALGNIGNPEVISNLIPLLRDTDLTVRLAAVRALEQIGDRRAVTHLKEVSENDSDDAVKKAAGRALSNFR